MLIEIDENYVQWVKRENPELFASGPDKKAVLQDYVNEVLAAHHKSWLDAEDQ